MKLCICYVYWNTSKQTMDGFKYNVRRFHVSNQLYTFLNVPYTVKVSKLLIIKKCIEYAKEHNIINYESKIITPDPPLRTLFNIPDNQPMLLTTMSKYINPHICSTSRCDISST